MQPVDPRLLALRDTIPGQVLQGTGGLRVFVRESIGEGGQGWVFRANWDDPEGYVVIVKVLRPDAITPESLVRFSREAQVLRMLGQSGRPNPHIVRFFDHATARFQLPRGGPVELPFTVLEHVRGPSLEDVLQRTKGTALALERVRRVGRQIVLALEDVHAQKVVHRDLKPSNVLLANEGGVETAKVTDFGLVKIVEINLGKTTALAGASLGYAPPEQFERGNRRVSARTDVFSFSAMLYEMLTGTRAFPYGDRENPLVIVTRLLNGPRPALATTKGSIPPELAARPDLVSQLDAQLTRATSAEPDDRHASITEFWAAVDPTLRTAAEGLSHHPRGGRVVSGVVEVQRESLDHLSRGPRSTVADQALASPSSWAWAVKAPPLHPSAIRAATFEPGAEAALAIGVRGFVRWQGTAWTHVTLPREIDEAAVQGIAFLGPSELLVYGSRGLVARVTPGGGAEVWTVPDVEITFLGAHVDGQGTVTVVGEKHAPRATRGGAASTTMGVMGQFVRGSLSVLANVPMCSRLRSVTRLRSGVLLACGDWGTIVRFELGVAEALAPACSGHLHAIAALEDGSAVAVGAGAHTIAISPSLRAQLEGVQTTRDLFALGVDLAGSVWTGSAQARLLRRTPGGWVRMSGELGLASSIVALSAAPRLVRAICDDGAVIEGHATSANG